MAIFGNRNDIINNSNQPNDQVTPIAPDTVKRTPINQEDKPVDLIQPSGSKVTDVHKRYDRRKDDSDIGWFSLHNNETILAAYNGLKYIVDQTAFGDTINATNVNIRGILNNVQALVKDPRYAVYSGLRNLKDALTGGIDIEDRIRVNQNNAMMDHELADQIATMSQFDPTGGILTAATASKLQNQLSRSYKYDVTSGKLSKEENNDKILGARNRAASRNNGSATEEYGFKVFVNQFDDILTDAKSTKGSRKPNDLPGVTKTTIVPSLQGYKTVQGLTIGSKYLWDITLDNYWCRDKDGKLLPTYAPMVPRPYTPLDNKFSWTNFIPAISYEFDDYSPLTNPIELLNDSDSNYISGYKKGNKVSITFVDDEEFTWTRFFDTYFKTVYDIRNNCVAPYKQTCLKIRLFNYSPGQNAYFFHKLIVIPTGFNMAPEGEESASALDFTVEFYIVGDEDNPEYEEF